MTRRRPWLEVFVILELMSLLTAVTTISQSPAIIGLSLVVAIIIPGLAVVRATLSPESIGSPLTLVALAVVVSAGIYIAAGLALTAFSEPLSHQGFAVPVDGVVVAACLWSVLKGRPETPKRWVRRMIGEWGVPLAALAAAGVVVGFMASLPGAKAMPYQAVYATGVNAATGRLVHVTHGRATVALAVANHTGSAKSYHLDGEVNDGTHWKSVRIAVPDGDTWRGQVAGPVPHAECPRWVRIDLRDAAGGRVTADLSVRFQQPPGRVGVSC